MAVPGGGALPQPTNGEQPSDSVLQVGWCWACKYPRGAQTRTMRMPGLRRCVAAHPLASSCLQVFKGHRNYRTVKVLGRA